MKATKSKRIKNTKLKNNSKFKRFLSNQLVKKALKIIKIILIAFFVSSVFFTILYRFINPPITPLMLIRGFEMKFEGKEFKIQKQWVEIENISKNMIMAVIAAEDQKFFSHFGFDFDAIEKAMINNSKDGVRIVKGGSTITQQTAKNLFLWPSRTWIRKGLEAWFTLLLEIFWTKERILEVYLNIIEFGEGIYGIEAASKHYYNKNAKDLTKKEATSLAVILPAPRKWNPTKPTPFLQKKTNWVMKQMKKFEYFANEIIKK